MRHGSKLHEYKKSNDPNHATSEVRPKMLFGIRMVSFLFFRGLGSGAGGKTFAIIGLNFISLTSSYALHQTGFSISLARSYAINFNYLTVY